MIISIRCAQVLFIPGLILLVFSACKLRLGVLVISASVYARALLAD